MVIHGLRWNDIDRKAVLRTHRLKQRDVPPATLPESMIIPYDDFPKADLFDEGLNENLRRQGSKSLCKGQDDETVQAEGFQRRCPFVYRRQERYGVSGKHFARMGFERNDNAPTLTLTGSLDQVADDGLVPHMHAVKRADRHHRRAVLLDLLQSNFFFHDSTFERRGSNAARSCSMVHARST
jgi:hypothetical protein